MEIVFVDLETGGVKPENPNIQLAAIAVNESWDELETFEAKIIFDESKCEPRALEINHYDLEVWAQTAKKEYIVQSDFDRFLNRHKTIEQISKAKQTKYMVARLAGHNAPGFDVPRLKAMYKDQFLPAHPLCLDTLQLALWFFRNRPEPKNYQLPTLLEYFGIPALDAHDALADVRGSIAIARALATWPV